MTAYWSAYWSWLRGRLHLTVGARVLLAVVLVVGVLVAVAGTVLAFYNVESGRDPDQVLGAQIAFSWIVVAIFEFVMLALVAAVDTGFRALVSRFANP